MPTQHPRCCQLPCLLLSTPTLPNLHLLSSFASISAVLSSHLPSTHHLQQFQNKNLASFQPSTHISFSQRFLHITRNSRNFSNTQTRGKRSSNGDEGCCHSASSPRPSSTRLHQASNRSSCPGSSNVKQQQNRTEDEDAVNRAYTWKTKPKQN